jgi:uncharacterized protein YbjT (DUF2867 family)
MPISKPSGERKRVTVWPHGSFLPLTGMLGLMARSNESHSDERHFMSSTQAAVVLGASGSVGNALIKELIRNRSFKPIVTLVRRSQPDQVAMARAAGVELRETLVPAMDPAGLKTATTEAIRSLEGDVVGLSVLGVGAGTAKLTIDEHRAVDVQLNAAFARGLKASGRVKHLAFMSAAGADPTAAATGSGAAGMARYARVKGEAEEAVKESGPAVVSIFRPAMIIGSQHTPWLLEKVLPAFTFVTPAKYKSITVEQIAKAMIATSLNTPAKSDVYNYPEMIALNR